MNIELKNIKHSPSLSEETEAFTANIYIDGRLVGHASNRGNGGSTDYDYLNEQGRELIKKAEAYCEKLPPMHYPAEDDMEAFPIPMNLEHYIDNLLGKHLDEKNLTQFRNKINKAMESAILVGVPDESFRTFSFKRPIAQILSHPRGHEVLADNIRDTVFPSLKDGEIILNTNIPFSVYAEAKVPDNLHRPYERKATKEAMQKKPGKKI